jgi:zinc transport system substrate-binding protein
VVWLLAERRQNPVKIHRQKFEACMKRILILIFLMLMPLLCGCVSQNEKPLGLIKVAATIAPLGELAGAVGGDKVQISVLVPPGAEPHTFEPAPSQIMQVANADLYVQNGAGLEFWMDKILQVNNKMVVVDSSKGIDLIRENGETMDPHIWLSLRNAAMQTKNICQALIQVDPANKSYYLGNRDDYLQNIWALDAELNRTFASKIKKIFIVHHPAWTYFARDYGLQQVALMENEKEPGPRYLADVIDLANKNKITTIFVEPEFNQKAAEVVAQEMNASIVYIDPLANNYLENMRISGKKIADSLE